MAAHSIELDRVTKLYGSVKAVDDLSLAVPEGSICGLIGPNGSGKTTTMRMVTGILVPDAGEIRVLGGRYGPRRLGAIGYLPEERGIYRKMTVRGLLRFHAELRGCRDAGPRVDSWLEKLNLGGLGSSAVETLSKGMTQKVQFIAAAITEPKLMILDEPFSGLDPVSAQAIREAILELRRNGATIVLSTHDMGTAEQMCEGIVMMFRGHKVLDGTLEKIQERYGSDTIRIATEGAVDWMVDLPGVEQIRDLGQVKEVRMQREADPQRLLQAVLERTRIQSFSVARPSLQDIFIRIAGPEPVVEERETRHA